MKKIIHNIAIIFFFALFFFNGQVFAQTTQEDSAKKFNVTFPVVELGNCTDFSSCKTYCQDPTHATECINFAKKKGFHKEVKKEQKNSIAENAKTELGCDSESSCRSICEKEENIDKCSSFAKKHNLGGGRVDDVKRKDIIEKAKQILGCDSPDSCKSFCEKEENRDKCSQLAKETGLRGGERRVGPGGCTSEESCRNFCEKNPKECGIPERREGDRISPPQGDIPEEMCKKTPSCKWENNRCECGFLNGQDRGRDNKEEFDKFCKENPEKCPDIERFKRESGEGKGDFEMQKPQDFKPQDFVKTEQRIEDQRNKEFKNQEQNIRAPISPGMKPPAQGFSEDTSNTKRVPGQKSPMEPNSLNKQQRQEFRQTEFKQPENRPQEQKSSEFKQPEFKPTEQNQPEQRPPEFKPPESVQQEFRPPETRIESQPSSSVQGVSTEKSFFEKVVDYFLVR